MNQWHKMYDSAAPLRRRLIQRTPDEPTSREIWLTITFIVMCTGFCVGYMWGYLQ
jgi:hypothetical protein